MPCPRHSVTSDEDRGIDRREFMKTALAIGGTSALAAARVRAHGDGGEDGDGHVNLPPGTDDPESLPNRQYAWNDFCDVSERTGMEVFPKHHLQFMLDYEGEGIPDDDDRKQVEGALRTLERAFEWSHKGLLFTLGYSPAYFDRFDEDLPDGTGLRRPSTVIKESDIHRSGDISVDDYDAHMHLGSDSALALLEAEEALFGNSDTVNGVDVAATFEGIFAKRDRRTGFIGNPHERWEEDIPGKNPVDEDATVFFGFNSLFADSQPTETEVAIGGDHPFADGTTEQVSLLRDEGLKAWYGRNSLEERVERMFSPHHDVDDTGQHGRGPEGEKANSGTDDETMNEIAADTSKDAVEKGVVGHAQKLARARKGKDNRPPLLRRDFPSTDGGRAHTQFISNQRTIDDFIDVRRAMAFVEHESDDPNAQSEVPLKDHGIQGYFQVQSRGTFLVPPRSLRALPLASP